MEPVIIVFARAPVAGRVKTRLHPAYSPREAAELHAAFVGDLVDSLRPAFSAAAIEIHSDIETDAFDHHGVARKLQCEGGLGAKLFHALCQGLDAGHSQVAVLGSDAPDLPVSHVAELMRSEADVSLGPASDGGFWGIACRRIHPAMFDGVRWSSSTALEDTLHAARHFGLSVEVGPEWHDIDTPGDVERLLRAPALGRNTAEALERMGRRPPTVQP